MSRYEYVQIPERKEKSSTAFSPERLKKGKWYIYFQLVCILVVSSIH
jgi:hypothetical protein